ncbi:DUF2079 domain-containing protein [Microseira wollei]|uniref:DUF2079 domain-containing protein n=1 Tax=Microseira wollei TaxID=467598 RepID=UPI0027D9B81A|nr:DUF2079 domain-containing protein [Microseira wollei]
MNIPRSLWVQVKSHPIGAIIVAFALIFFASSSIRHALLQSSAWDLAIFDQAVYLISQGQSPISSLIGFHILGDHAAFLLYPLALLYKIYPDVHWLLALQALALAFGALPTWYLSLEAGLKKTQAIAMVAVYLLYPLVFNINLFDFHPEVFALPGILAAVLAARLGAVGWFCVWIILVLSCKAVLALTVAAMGLWLLVFEKRRLCGAIALCTGIAWFIIATGVIIPFFGGELATIGRHLSRYQHLGNSFSEIVKNLLLQPGLFIKSVFSLANLEYLVLLSAPIIWGIYPQHLTPLVGAIPALAMNILADDLTQKNLVHQYSLPVLPFLLLAVISSLAAGRGWLRPRGIIIWSLVAFLALAKYGYFGSIYLNSLDNWQATRDAISQIKTSESVLTTHNIAPHLAQRRLIKFTNADSPPTDLNEFEYILLNLRHPGWKSSREFAENLVNKVQDNPNFKLKFKQDDVYLFNQTNRS